jgi:zinc transporter 1/2/3
LLPSRQLHTLIMIGTPEYHEAYQETLNLRILAVFVLLFASLMGVVPPFLLRGTDTPAFWILKALSAGVLLSLGLVHLLPEAAADFAVLSPSYPALAEVSCISGFLFMFIVDQLLLVYFTPEDAVDSHKHCDFVLPTAVTDNKQDDPDAPKCLQLKARVFAYLMEMGAALHSVLIGMGLGIIVGNKSEVIVLTVAISIHQMLEGLGLAGMVRAANLSRWQSAGLALSYALTTPVGVALGILLSGNNYNPDSHVSRGITGALNGIASGLIIYIAVVHLIIEEFTKKELRGMRRTRLGMHIALLMGLLCMCIIAYWA